MDGVGVVEERYKQMKEEDREINEHLRIID